MVTLLRQVAAGGVTFLLTLPGLLGVPAVASGQLQAGPTLLEINHGETSTRLFLRNPGPESVAAQVRVYAWSQPQGEDLLVPTEDLAVSPPIMELSPGGEQVVRLVRLGPPPEGPQDRTYRVVIDELPRTDGVGDGQVELRMRYVVPAFVRAADAAPPALSCTLGDGGRRLTCENRGGRAARLGASRLVDERGGALSLSNGLFGYVLPWSRRSWALPRGSAAPDGPSLRLESQLDGRPTTLAVERVP